MFRPQILQIFYNFNKFFSSRIYFFVLNNIISITIMLSTNTPCFYHLFIKNRNVKEEHSVDKQYIFSFWFLKNLNLIFIFEFTSIWLKIIKLIYLMLSNIIFVYNITEYIFDFEMSTFHYLFSFIQVMILNLFLIPRLLFQLFFLIIIDYCKVFSYNNVITFIQSLNLI